MPKALSSPAPLQIGTATKAVFYVTFSFTASLWPYLLAFWFFSRPTCFPLLSSSSPDSGFGRLCRHLMSPNFALTPSPLPCDYREKNEYGPKNVPLLAVSSQYEHYKNRSS